MRKILLSIIILGTISCKTTSTIKNETTMQLTPKIKEILSHLETIQVFQGKNPLDISRKNYDAMAQQLSGSKEAVFSIEEFNIPSKNHQIPVRLYRPKGKTSNSSAIIYIHGGWFISGGYETHDAIARKLSNETEAVLLFVDYRLAPENPFPAGLNDCKDATAWLINNAKKLGIDVQKIGVIGDSAGGALATALSLELGSQLKFQVLIYPASDNSLSTASWENYKNGPILNKEWGLQAWNWYLKSQEDKTNPLAVPVLIKDFKKTPETLVIIAQHDPLKDEGEKLAQNMKNSGVSVKKSLYKDMVHGFMHMGILLPETQLAAKEIAEFITKSLEK
ncbi:alpha/beta hydrolase [Sphingobacterium sp.]|uniref:alpha/beta hydrolase n=1 Tax=Sphingobacterium sp. TaxID=341027 RepID=UPI0028AD1BAA|nr:alpha/beta hydrolase [Sphingobacterium sp.]